MVETGWGAFTPCPYLGFATHNFEPRRQRADRTAARGCRVPSREHARQEIVMEQPGVFETEGGRFWDRGGELEQQGV
jgi:hypothetical protein